MITTVWRVKLRARAQTDTAEFSKSKRESKKASSKTPTALAPRGEEQPEHERRSGTREAEG